MRNILDTLVTDRTKEDVDRAREMDRKGWARMLPAERAEYAAGPKGAYTRHDMNRVVGTMEYLDSLMAVAGVESGYQPVTIFHRTVAGTWSDTVWIDEDKPRASAWAAHLANVRRFWDGVSVISAVVAPRWDPQGNGYIGLGDTFTARDVCAVSQVNGLLSITLTVSCPAGAAAASGTGWSVTKTAGGLTAVYEYPGNLYLDVVEALGALTIRCTAEDGIVDASIAFSAALRYGRTVRLGTCAVRWSPFVIWRELREDWPSWGALNTPGVTWDWAARGGSTDD